MRVLHVYRTYFPDTQGGLQETIRQICRNTQPQGAESRVFTLSQNPQPAVVRLPEAEVHRFPLSFEIASCGFSFKGWSGFNRLAEWADIVHYHFPWPFADLLQVLGRGHRPSLATYHSDIVRQQGLLRLYRPLKQRFLERVDRIVATSPNYLETSQTLARFADKVQIIPIGLDRASYPDVSDPQLETLCGRVGQDFFLFIGVLRYYKGLHILLESIQNAPFRLLIAGSGPMEQSLKNQVERLGLTNVHFLGQISDQEKVALIRLCRGMVFPSHLRSEAFGITLLEGAMFGKPLISTEIGTGTSYINRHGETGIVVPPDNRQALREAMESLHQDRASAERMGQAARMRYEHLFTGRRMGELYGDLYRALLREH